MGRVVSPYCSRSLQPAAPPTLPVAAFEIADSVDAFDAVDLSRPDGFTDGIIVLLLSEANHPFLSIAVEHAPSANLDAIVSLLVDVATENADLFGVVFGVVRSIDSAPKERRNANGGRVVWLSADELSAWGEARNELAGHGIDVVDFIVIEPSGWCGLADHLAADPG